MVLTDLIDGTACFEVFEKGVPDRVIDGPNVFVVLDPDEDEVEDVEDDEDLLGQLFA